MAIVPVFSIHDIECSLWTCFAREVVRCILYDRNAKGSMIKFKYNINYILCLNQRAVFRQEQGDIYEIHRWVLADA